MKSDIVVRREVENLHVNIKYKLKAGFSYFYFLFPFYIYPLSHFLLSLHFIPGLHTHSAFYTQSAFYTWSAVCSLHLKLTTTPWVLIILTSPVAYCMVLNMSGRQLTLSDFLVGIIQAKNFGH